MLSDKFNSLSRPLRRCIFGGRLGLGCSLLGCGLCCCLACGWVLPALVHRRRCGGLLCLLGAGTALRRTSTITDRCAATPRRGLSLSVSPREAEGLIFLSSDDPWTDTYWERSRSRPRMLPFWKRFFLGPKNFRLAAQRRKNHLITEFRLSPRPVRS